MDKFDEQLSSELETLRTQVTTLEHTVMTRAKVESALRQELAMTRQYVDLAGVILLALDIQGEITLINAKGCAILGWDRDGLIGQNWFETCVPPEARASVWRAFQQLVAGDIEPVEFFENPVLTRSGEQRLIAWHNSMLTDEAGRVVGTLSSGEDITQYRQAREALWESEERYQGLFNEVPIGLYKSTQSGRIVDANQALVNMLGYPDRESLLAGTGQDLFVFPEERQEEQALLKREGVIQRFQMQLRRHDGTIIWVEDNARSVRDGEGREYYEGSLTDITDRKHAELALLESEARFRSVAQAAPDAIITADSQGNIVFWNEAAESMFGYEISEIIGQSLTLIMPARYRQRHTEGMARFLATKDAAIIGRKAEFIGLRRDGSEFPLEFTLAAWDVGENTFFSAILRDITDRKEAEEVLRKLSRAVEQSPSSVMITDTRGNIEYVNPKFAQVTGYRPEEVIGQNPRILRSGETSPEEYQRLWATITSGGEWRGEFHNRKKNGELFWESISISPVKDANGEITHFLSVAEDITKRKQIEAAERDQRILAEALSDTAAILTSTLDVNVVMQRVLEQVGRVVPHDAANIMLLDGTTVRVVAWHGYQQHKPSESFLREHQFSLEAPQLREMFETRLPVLITDTTRFPGWEQRPDTAWIRSHAAAPILAHGQVVGFLNLDGRTPGFFTQNHIHRLQAFADQAAIALENAQLYDEIRRRANELEQRVQERTAQLNHAKERVEAILNSSNDVIVLCRADGTIDQVNPVFDTTFQCKPDEVFNQPLTTLVVPDHIAALNQAFAATVETRQPERLELTIHYPQRTTFDADVVLSPIVEPNNRLVGVVCSLRDITEQKRMETQLRHMLEHEIELGDLKSRYMAMAAHDLRNPLAVIQSAVSMIQNYYDRITEEQRQTKFARIRTSIQVMVDMLDDILTLGEAEAGQLSFEPARIDVIGFCEQIVMDIKQATGARQHIDFTACGECGPSHMDAKLLRHILGNLLSNAFKYSPDGSVVTFTVDCEPDQIAFHVQDHGIGIPEADQKRLFEVFHRASNAKRVPGTGLGLAIVKQSVELHGGVISFESEEGRGTTFTVMLPRIDTEVIDH